MLHRHSAVLRTDKKLSYYFLELILLEGNKEEMSLNMTSFYDIAYTLPSTIVLFHAKEREIERDERPKALELLRVPLKAKTKPPEA